MSKLIMCAYGAYESIIKNYDNQIDNKVCLWFYCVSTWEIVVVFIENVTMKIDISI